MILGGSKKWQPIFVGAEAEKIFEVVLEIAESLRTPPYGWIPEGPAEPFRIVRDASLSQGSAGLALFFAYLAQMPGVKPGIPEEADRFLNHACNALEEGMIPPCLFAGISGIARTTKHIRRLVYISDNSELDPNEEVNLMLGMGTGELIINRGNNITENFAGSVHAFQPGILPRR